VRLLHDGAQSLTDSGLVAKAEVGSSTASTTWSKYTVIRFMPIWAIFLSENSFEEQNTLHYQKRVLRIRTHCKIHLCSTSHPLERNSIVKECLFL
jgi:hypothetical protein